VNVSAGIERPCDRLPKTLPPPAKARLKTPRRYSGL